LSSAIIALRVVHTFYPFPFNSLVYCSGRIGPDLVSEKLQSEIPLV